MISKEALEMIRSVDGSISAKQTINECCNIIQKDLEDYEELKNLMGTPIQDIMKRLKTLEALKRNVGIRLAIQEWANKETKVFPNDRKIVKEWLDDK